MRHQRVTRTEIIPVTCLCERCVAPDGEENIEQSVSIAAEPFLVLAGRLQVDKAARAVRTATKNARANGLNDVATFLKADVAAFAGASSSSAAADAEASGPGERKAWDLVVVDPPSFLAKSARSTARAVKA